jgi:hypothetical protein
MKAQNEVTNNQANQVIENFKLESKNAVKLDDANFVDKIQFTETVTDLTKQAEQIFPTCKGWKFKGENIKVLVYFVKFSKDKPPQKQYTSITFKNYTGKIETFAKTVSDKIQNSFAAVRGKGKMNIALEIDGLHINIKSDRVYHMNRKNIGRGSSALAILQSYAYMHES